MVAVFISLDCPNCMAKNASFRYCHHYSSPKSHQLMSCFYACCVCHKGICIEMRSKNNKVPSAAGVDVFNIQDFEIFKINPPMPTSRIPMHVPSDVIKIFKQAANTIHSPDLADSAGAMCRKTLDMAVKCIDIDNKLVGDLYEKIKKMVQHNMITPTLGDWAHLIRKLGNDASHDFFTHDEAKSLFNFTEIFLIYIFTLPELIKLMKENPEYETRVFS